MGVVALPWPGRGRALECQLLSLGSGVVGPVVCAVSSANELQRLSPSLATQHHHLHSASIINHRHHLHPPPHATPSFNHLQTSRRCIAHTPVATASHGPPPQHPQTPATHPSPPPPRPTRPPIFKSRAEAVDRHHNARPHFRRRPRGLPVRTGSYPAGLRARETER